MDIEKIITDTNDKIVCNICGAEITDISHDYCFNCGARWITDAEDDKKQQGNHNQNKFIAAIDSAFDKWLNSSKSNNEKKENKLKKYMKYCFIVAVVMFCMGFHKANFYKNSEYSWGKTVNAYVGGDAYNYIINSNYATGYYVLSVGFMLTGTICGCTDEIIKSKKD